MFLIVCDLRRLYFLGKRIQWRRNSVLFAFYLFCQYFALCMFYLGFFSLFLSFSLFFWLSFCVYAPQPSAKAVIKVAVWRGLKAGHTLWLWQALFKSCRLPPFLHSFFGRYLLSLVSFEILSLRQTSRPDICSATIWSKLFGLWRSFRELSFPNKTASFDIEDVFTVSTEASKKCLNRLSRAV